MKYAVAIIAAFIVLGGLWYGIGSWRRNAMLDSGRPVLLINKKASSYTYSDLMPRDEITRGYKIIGYADDISMEETRRLTQGLNFVMGVAAPANDPRLPSLPQNFAYVPTPDEQRRWSAALALLTEPQKILCAAIEDSALAQPCLSRHLVFNAIKANSGDQICASIYIMGQRDECRAHIVSKNLESYTDADNDSLIDAFEANAVPYEQRTNTLNLPVINPSE